MMETKTTKKQAKKLVKFLFGDSADRTAVCWETASRGFFSVVKN